MNRKILDIIKTKSDEDEIKMCIKKTLDDLQTIEKKGNCKTYSAYLSYYLRMNHIPNKVVRTSDLGYNYSHDFVLVPKDSNNYYLIDLTYEQFNNENFKELLFKGYEEINDLEFDLYMSVVTGEINNYSLDDIFFKTNKKR